VSLRKVQLKELNDMKKDPDIRHIIQHLGAGAGITQDGHLLTGIEPGMQTVVEHQGRGYGPRPGTTWHPTTDRPGKPNIPLKQKIRLQLFDVYTIFPVFEYTEWGETALQMGGAQSIYQDQYPPISGGNVGVNYVKAGEDPSGEACVYGLVIADYLYWQGEGWPQEVLDIIDTMLNVTYWNEVTWFTYVESKLVDYPAYWDEVKEAGKRRHGTGMAEWGVTMNFITAIPEGESSWENCALWHFVSQAVRDEFEVVWQKLLDTHTYTTWPRGSHASYEPVPEQEGWLYSHSKFYRIGVRNKIDTSGLDDFFIQHGHREQDYGESGEYQSRMCTRAPLRIHEDIEDRFGEVYVRVVYGAGDKLILDQCNFVNTLQTIPRKVAVIYGSQIEITITIKPYGFKVDFIDSQSGTKSARVIFTNLFIQSIDFLQDFETGEWEENHLFEYPEEYPEDWPSAAAQQAYLDQLKAMSVSFSLPYGSLYYRWMSFDKGGGDWESKRFYHDWWKCYNPACLRIKFKGAADLPDVFDPFDVSLF